MNKIKHISYSQHNLYNHCPRMFQFERIMKLTPKNVDESAMNFGTLIHKALNVLFLTKSINNAHSVLEDADDVFDNPKYSIEFAHTCLNLYWEENKGFVENFVIIATEQVKEYEINGITVKIVIDLIGSYNEENMIIDFKTSSITKVDMDMENQADYYIMGAQLCYDLKVDYVLFQCLITTKKPKYETYRAFRTQYNLEDFKKDVIIFHDRLERKEFPKNTANCYKFFRACRFKHLCLAFNEEDFNFKLKNCYEVKT